MGGPEAQFRDFCLKKSNLKGRAIVELDHTLMGTHFRRLQKIVP